MKDVFKIVVLLPTFIVMVAIHWLFTLLGYWFCKFCLLVSNSLDRSCQRVVNKLKKWVGQ